jgi:hypothetical protein
VDPLEAGAAETGAGELVVAAGGDAVAAAGAAVDTGTDGVCVRIGGTIAIAFGWTVRTPGVLPVDART